jgi:hypothetical protein
VVSRSPRAVSAAVVESAQDAEDRLLDADVRVKARAIGRGSDVQLDICADRGGAFSAGEYTGKVSIYGPRVQELRYSFGVTQRWLFAVPLLILAGTAVVYLALVWRSPLPPGSDPKKGETPLFVLVALFGLLGAYFAIYLVNPTWGDAGLSDITGLITAAFTAAGAATAAVVGLRNQAANGGNELESEPDPGPDPAPQSG